MIIDARIETRDMGDARVLGYLRTKGFDRCIDFGGVQRPWACKHVTTYVDLWTPEEWSRHYPGMYAAFPEIWRSKVLVMDCEAEETWGGLARLVAREGKFDFVISTHMLEHLLHPVQFLRRLPSIAHEGYIGVPNKVFELGRGREFSEEGLARCGLTDTYRGAFSHKWIFTVREDVLWALPKLGALECVDLGWEDDLKHYEPLDFGQLGFFWKEEIPVRLVDDKDIGFPTPQEGIEFYRNILRHGL